jgi:hypothetical protein
LLLLFRLLVAKQATKQATSCIACILMPAFEPLGTTYQPLTWKQPAQVTLTSCALWRLSTHLMHEQLPFVSFVAWLVPN